MTSTDGIVVRSYRVVFDLERRIHKVDRWRIPLPYGLPLRGIAYAALALVAVLIAGRVPIVGLALDGLPTPVRYAVLPGGTAYVLMQLRLDGRPAHSTLRAWVRLVLGPRRVVGFRRAMPADAAARLGTVTFSPDERCGRYRRSKVSGPTQVMLRYPAQAQQRGNALKLRQSDGRPMWRGKWITLGRRQRLEFR